MNDRLAPASFNPHSLGQSSTSADQVTARRRRRPGPEWQRIDWLYLVLLAAIISLAWCSHYGRWSIRAWKTPVDYIGAREWDMTYASDGLWGLAATKLMAEGEISFLSKRPTSLGAPLGANWNDWPSIEEGVNAWWALLVFLFGLGNGSNITVLSACVFAGVTFYLVCRYLRYEQLFSLAGGVLFGLSRLAFWRSLPNLSLTFYWHVPLGLLVTWWCTLDKPIVRDRKKLALCGVTAILFGTQSPYYAGMFLQLLFWAALFTLVRSRDWRRLLLPSAIGAVLLATLAVVNLDTLSSHAERGFNAGVIHRWYSDLEKYALKPVDLFLPRSHALGKLERWTNKTYFTKTLLGEEVGSAYLGVIGSIAFLLLAYVAARAVARTKTEPIPIHFWGVCLVMAFSVIGGINGLVGLWGIWLFKASNRYSIVILALLLLFLVKWLGEISQKWSRQATIALTILIVIAGIYDQVPPQHPERANDAQALFREDRLLIERMEARLPPMSNVFQLPVFPFPEGLLEGPQLATMEDYDQFRPYIHSHQTRFSYGDAKGRYENRWQKEAEQLGPEALVRLLEQYGFAAILLNRDGYADRGEGLLAALRAAGKTTTLARSRTFVCIALSPARRVTLPPIFGKGWYGLEGVAEKNLRWCSGDGILTLSNPGPSLQRIRLVFGLKAFSRRHLEISTAKQTLYDAEIIPGEDRERIDLEVELAPGRNEIRFTTDRPGSPGSSGDSRKLAFGLLDFRVLESSANAWASRN